MSNLYIGLVHYPVLNRMGEIVAAALTGLDTSDIARSARTYEVRKYYLITPLQSQREIASRIKSYWTNANTDADRGNTFRGEALKLMEIVATLEESLQDIVEYEGREPLIVGTSARPREKEQISYQQLRARIEQGEDPVYILFGTGWGLADPLIERLDYMLPPLFGPGDYNHLSVRAAVAIILDRLRGRQ